VELKLVQQSRCQVLLSDLGAAPKHDVFAVGGLPCLFERGLDSVGDEVERGPSLHLHRITRVMGEDEHGVVVGRVVAPPARPLLVARGTTADRANMFRPITPAPTFSTDSSDIRVLSLTSPPCLPWDWRQAASGTTQSWSRSPPSPSGFSSHSLP
jgi:hypothetical protein